MFDNLRDSASDFYEEEPNNVSRETVVRPVVSRQRRNTRFLGMSPQQRFILSMMLMLTVCVVGVLAMFVLGRMSLF